MSLFESFFGFSIPCTDQSEQAWQQQVAQRAQTLARQQADYEAQCELFRRNQEARGAVIDGEFRVIEDPKLLRKII